jgi:hypothetical protein
LRIDSDAELAPTISSQGLKTIACVTDQIFFRSGREQYLEAAICLFLKTGELGNTVAVGKPGSQFVTEK